MKDEWKFEFWTTAKVHAPVCLMRSWTLAGGSLLAAVSKAEEWIDHGRSAVNAICFKASGESGFWCETGGARLFWW